MPALPASLFAVFALVAAGCQSSTSYTDSSTRFALPRPPGSA
ncbi:MAG TPA: hypothetical protein VF100_04775 [Thermoanaerobaculia bacterium]